MEVSTALLGVSTANRRNFPMYRMSLGLLVALAALGARGGDDQSCVQPTASEALEQPGPVSAAADGATLGSSLLQVPQGNVGFQQVASHLEASRRRRRAPSPTPSPSGGATKAELGAFKSGMEKKLNHLEE